MFMRILQQAKLASTQGENNVSPIQNNPEWLRLKLKIPRCVHTLSLELGFKMLTLRSPEEGEKWTTQTSKFTCRPVFFFIKNDCFVALAL